MKIGIIGKGVVGTAIKKGFEYIDHTVKYHDIKHDTVIEDVLDTEIIYICVGTPSTKDGSCDISAVLEVTEQLHRLKYKGVVAIKSTVKPGTTDKLKAKYKDLELCFVPEFLRERCAYDDFVHNNSILIVGTDKREVFELVEKSHGELPTHKLQSKVIEAELMKYFSNTYKAMRIIFANSFYKLAEHYNANYNVIKDAFLFHAVEEGHYLRVNKDFGLGYGGMCLPKDTKAMKNLVEEENLNLKIFEFLELENEKLKKNT
tara:strand:+ start:16223 stop:17002 length:780 start_codon:yes stop_codon:yes gene_type:complete